MFMFDNNLAPSLAQALAILGEEACHLQDEFAADCADKEWLAEIGDRGWFLVTRDRNILKNKAEQAALRRHNVGAFFLSGKGLSRWDLVQQVIRNWPRILELADSTHRPFAILIPPNGTKYKTVF